MKRTTSRQRPGKYTYTVTLEDGKQLTVRAANADTAAMIASLETGRRVWSVN